MRVLITGGSGFIGSHLAERLLARHDDVCVIDNFATGRRDNLDLRAERLQLIEASIADEGVFKEVAVGFRPDVIVHAAASYKDPDDWVEDARTNVTGSAIVAKAARELDLSRLIYFQTALCYGLHPREQPITVRHPLIPGASSYAISKTAGEHYVALSGVDYVSFRLANAYGPRNMSGPLPTFYQRLTTGRPCFVMDTRRDFIFVADLIDLVLKAIDGEGRSGVYHVSSGRDVSILDLFNATVAALGLELATAVEMRPRGDDDAATILLDPSETNSEFEWCTSTDLAEGVAAAISYYQEYGVWETYTHLRVEESADSGSGG